MRKQLARREFFRAAAAAGMGLGLTSLLPGYAAMAGGPTLGLSSGRRLHQGVIDLNIGYANLPIGDEIARPTTINGTLPGPLLRFTEGDEAVIRVANSLDEDTSIHWHGILLPPEMDGVPGVSFDGIKPHTTFEYRYRFKQSGTYWYHSHSGVQEQQGVYGPLVIDPLGTDPIEYDREHVIVLSDWTFEDASSVLSKLKKKSNYYNYNKRTVAGLLKGEGGSIQDRLAWSRMRMDATDLADVTGATYTYLLNGTSPEQGWTGLFKAGEKVRLRFINAGSATFFDVRIPGLKMTVVQADGQNVKPVVVDEFRIALAETYDVIVEPEDETAYAIFAESMDRSGYAAGILAPRAGLVPELPQRRKPATRTMADMGMSDHGNMSMSDGGDMIMDGDSTASGSTMENHDGMDHAAMGHGAMGGGTGEGIPETVRAIGEIPATTAHGKGSHGPGNAGVPMMTSNRLSEPGIGLEDAPHRVLVYSDLKKADEMYDERLPSREIELHLTGNMERYMWSFDGKKFSSGMDPIQLRYGERVRLILVNDTMMEHPIHLHGMWLEVENGHGTKIPRKHTINVKPAERVSLLVTADAVGRWAMHCHILYHMEAGMFRVVEVLPPANAEVISER